MALPRRVPKRLAIFAAVFVIALGVMVITVERGRNSNDSPTGKLGNKVTATQSQLPAEFPQESVPLPEQGLTGALANTEGEGKSFNLSYTGADLTVLVQKLRTDLVNAGFEISGEYNADVKKVPSAGFVAKSKDWIVTVGGVSQNGEAAVNASVTKLV